jgi:hypothetical protein
VNGVVQAKFLGRFGNQLHQYAACRKYAEMIGAEFEVSSWVGQDIFGLSDSTYSRELPERDGDAVGSFEWGETNIRLCGYFQLQRWVELLSRAELRSWLTVRPELLEVCRVPGSYTAAHLRQGDYIGNASYANVPERSYLRACAEHGLTIDVWARENAPRHVLGVPDFLPDFVTLMCADVLLRANSTFSWWAGVIGGGRVYSPVVTDHTGEYDADFVLGNWPRLMRASEDLHLSD